MEKFPIYEKGSPAEKVKNIYTYYDDSAEEEEIVFQTMAMDMAEANEKYKKETGHDPKEQPHISCRTESLLEKQKKEYYKFMADVVAKEGISVAEFGEREEKQTYEDYLEKLNLTDEALKNKKILDLGAGKCFFASYCAKNGISQEVYSVEGGEESYADREIKKIIWTNQIRSAVEGKRIRALAQGLPFKERSLELVLGNAAMPGRDKEYFGNLNMAEDMDRTYDEIVRILASGGEARLQPFNADEDDKYFGEWAKATKTKLAELSKKGDVDVTMEKLEYGENLFRVIIRKK